MGKIYPQKRNGQVVGYSVYFGVSPDGRRERRFFAKLESAQNFVRVQTTDPRPVAELFDRKAELLYALEQLRSPNEPSPHSKPQRDVVSVLEPRPPTAKFA